jgi:uncharacterized membrane protein
MSDLIAIVYPSEAKAEEVRQRLFKLQKEYLRSSPSKLKQAR